MTKAEILSEIKRVAAENNGAVPGFRTFERETGIKERYWAGVYWRSWGDAVREAGLTPNALTPKIADDELLRKYCLLAREIGRFPAQNDLRLKKRSDPTFPSDVVFFRRFGSFPAARQAAFKFAVAHSEFADLKPFLKGQSNLGTVQSPSKRPTVGFVYPIKHGSRSEYKIGKTYNPLRREGEMRLQLPEMLKPMHYIETDDPSGIEAYWHSRFASKRKEGEWFALSRDDVAAFKRWKRIV